MTKEISVETLNRSIWRCTKTGIKFETFGLGDGRYGEYVLHAQNGDLAYWIVVEDHVFDEIVRIVSNLAEKWSLSKGLLSGFIYGICCDLAPDGSVYRTIPYCPICFDGKVSLVDVPEPYQRKVFDIPYATHLYWNSLSNEEKTSMAENELKRVGLI